MHHWVYKSEVVPFDEANPALVGQHLTELAGTGWELVTTCPLPAPIVPGGGFHFMATYKRACECETPMNHL